MKRLTLRLPDEMHAALRALADREHRSMHAEVLHILSREIAREEARDIPIVTLSSLTTRQERGSE